MQKVTADTLVPTKGTDNDLCIVRPHIGETRCKAHHEESWDENRFSVWDENGYSAHYAKEA